MRYTTKHFRVHDANTVPKVNMEEEVEIAANNRDVSTRLRIRPDGKRSISRIYALVENVADLDTLADRLANFSGDKEIGFCPDFSPELVDNSCQRGIFPLAVSFGNNIFCYAPKLHLHRMLARLVPEVEGFPECSEENEGLFLASRLKVSKRFLRPQNDSTRAVSFDVFINRPEDLAPVFHLIWAQHHENWLCRALRACLIHMFFNRDAYRTQIVIVAIRRHRYSTPTAAPPPREKLEKLEKDEELERAEKAAKLEKDEKAAKLEKDEELERAEKPAKLEKDEELERVEKAAKLEKDEKAAKLEKAAKARADGDAVMEGDLVACEVGFIVGDVYCSMTGAYAASGAGALQLAATGPAVRAAGCRVWDLGMAMPYKEALGCVALPRKEWMRFVRGRQEADGKGARAKRIVQALREGYKEGVPVVQLVG